MVSSVISWTLFFWLFGFEGVRISIWCWGLRLLLQVGEIAESNTCLKKESSAWNFAPRMHNRKRDGSGCAGYRGYVACDCSALAYILLMKITRQTQHCKS